MTAADRTVRMTTAEYRAMLDAEARGLGRAPRNVTTVPAPRRSARKAAPAPGKRIARIDPALRGISEETWQRKIQRAYLARYEWEYLHVRRARGHRKGEAGAHQTPTNIKGWPDLEAWSPRWPGRHLVLEVKRETGSLDADQHKVLTSLLAAGYEVYAPVRPRHADELVRILTTHPSTWGDWTPTCAYSPK